MRSVPGSPADHLLIDRARYYLGTEYRTKLHHAVEALPPDALWWRPNDSSNSVGNLIVHLVGNMRQWIVSGIGRVPPSRNRAAEFAMRDGPPASQLLQDLDRALIEVDEVLSTLSAAQLAPQVQQAGAPDPNAQAVTPGAPAVVQPAQGAPKKSVFGSIFGTRASAKVEQPAVQQRKKIMGLW